MSTISSLDSHLSYMDEPLVVLRTISQVQSNLHPIMHKGAICIHKPLSKIYLFHDKTYITISNIFITSHRDISWNIEGEDTNLITIYLSLEWLKSKLSSSLFNEIERKLEYDLITTELNFSTKEIQTLQNVSLFASKTKNSYFITPILFDFFKTFCTESKNTLQEFPKIDLQLVANLHKKYIANFCLKMPSIESLSKEVGFSPSKLKKIFKDIYGKSIYQSYMEIRLANALKMLEEGYNVKSVASQLGYTQPIKFIKAFQRQYGVTPGKVKK